MYVKGEYKCVKGECMYVKGECMCVREPEWIMSCTAPHSGQCLLAWSLSSLHVHSPAAVIRKWGWKWAQEMTADLLCSLLPFICSLTVNTLKIQAYSHIQLQWMCMCLHERVYLHIKHRNFLCSWTLYTKVSVWYTVITFHLQST